MICSECKKEKPDSEFVSKFKSRIRKTCQKCSDKNSLKSMKHKNNKFKTDGVVFDGFKKCFGCLKIKEIIEFKTIRPNNDNVYGIYCHVCSKYFREKSLVWKKQNPNKEKEAHQNYLRNNRERVLAQKVSKYQENPELARQKTAIWQKLNMDKVYANNARRRAAKVNASPLWLTSAQKAEIEGFYLYCQIFPGHQVDHVVPLRNKSVCGLHVPWNLQILTAEENMRKGNRFNGD